MKKLLLWKLAPMNKLLTCCLLAAGLALPTGAGYGQTVISVIPFSITQPGKYILQSNLTLSAGGFAGIAVMADDVEIDLNGYTLIGSLETRRITVVGISASGRSNVVIRNGAITKFFSGIEAQTTEGLLVDNVTVFANLKAGIVLRNCKNTTIRNCKIDKSLPDLPPSIATGIQIFEGIGNQVTNTSVSGIGNELYPFGIASINSSGNYFADDYIVSCKIGLQLSPADKYRSITTTDCPVPISGGNDVDNISN
jgi:hypothetical protein